MADGGGRGGYAQALQTAQPDGYTLNVGGLPSNVLNGAAYPLSYDLVKDFEPIALLSTNPYLLITRKTAVAEIRPIDDIRSTARYRAAVVGNLVAVFLERLGAPAANHE